MIGSPRIKQSTTNCFKDSNRRSIYDDSEMTMKLTQAVQKLNSRKLDKSRTKPLTKRKEAESESDDDGLNLFVANPADDIPRNKLTEQLARGLQAYVQRMQKRESFYAELTVLQPPSWNPAPREYSTLTYCNRRVYLIGGLNYDCNSEVAQLKMDTSLAKWTNMPYTTMEKINGRCRHSSCAYQDKIYTFGGCFMFNRKRQIRECTAQLMIYDTIDNTVHLAKTKGIAVQQRKDHCSAIVGQSMVVFGGQFENDTLTSEMLTLDLQFNDWQRLYYKGQMEPQFQMRCCAVAAAKKVNLNMAGSLEQQMTRMSDIILDGIYYFGGKNTKGEMSNKLKYLKTTLIDGKIASAEWTKIKQQGIPPCGRVGHQMSYLPCNQALIVVGGRNDQLCRVKNIPFLDDMFLFLLDQKSWLQVKYIPSSPQICLIGNHSMEVVTDGESEEKILIFGGITNHLNKETSALTNQIFQLEIR